MLPFRPFHDARVPSHPIPRGSPLRLLVANDDGPESPALHALVASLSAVHEVGVAIPAGQRSGTGHGFTFVRPFRVERSSIAGAPALLVDALPADAVKYALCELPFGRPDLVLSGINPGENAGLSAPYSGTVACAREAALWGFPALALSSAGMSEAHWRAIADWTVRLLAGPLPPTPRGVFWNVNFPEADPGRWKEPRVCAGGLAMFRDAYRRQDDGLLQLAGVKLPSDLVPGTDDDWLHRGHPVLVPHRVDSTAHELLAECRWTPPAVPQETT